jgi:Tol biopolymer transport system component
MPTLWPLLCTALHDSRRGEEYRRGVVRVLTAVALVFSMLATAACGEAKQATPRRDTILFASTRAPDLHGEVWLLDLRTGTRRNLSRDPASDHYAAQSPDGASVAFVSDRDGREAVYVASTSGTYSVRRLAGPFDDPPAEPSNGWTMNVVGPPAWSSDGSRVAFRVVGADGTAAHIVGTGGADVPQVVVRLPSSGAGPLGQVAWSPRAPLLALEGSVRAADGREVFRFPGDPLSWSARGDLSTVSGNWVSVFRGDGRRTARMKGSWGTWNRTGSLLAATGTDGIRVVAADGTFRFHRRGFSFHSWADDDTVVAYGPDRVSYRIALDGRARPTDGVPAAAAFSNTQGDRLWLDGRTVVLQRDGRRQRFTHPSTATATCPAGLEVVAWQERDQLVYSFGRGGQHHSALWIADPADGEVTPFLGVRDRWAEGARWSPDGNQVVFEHGTVLTHASGCLQDSPGLRLATAAGELGRTLGSTLAADTYANEPVWSPNGRFVAFEQLSYDSELGHGITLADTHSADEPLRLTRGIDSTPSWSYDGRSVVYERGAEVRVVSLESGAVTRLAAGRLPAAAPAADAVAFVRNDGLWIMSLDGSRRRLLAPAQGATLGLPAWEPNAERVAVADEAGILVVRADGSERRRIAAPGARDLAWSREGRWLSYVRPDGLYSRGTRYITTLRSELWVVAAAGGGPRQLTHDLANVEGGSWRP